MKPLRFPLMALFVSLPFIAGATATVKITSPTKSPTTNGVLNASGTASGVGNLDVFYSFDGGAWTQASGSTNWNASGLVLTPGPNTFSAYVEDLNGLSKTNTVTSIYVVNVPMTVLTNGNGTTSPNYNGKSLEIGKKYSDTAKGAKGFGFVGWDLNGNPYTNSSHIFFTMESNLTLTANFKDIARPVCVITFPAVKHSVSNSPINVTGRASDNVGVTAVNYQLNGGGWNPATLTDPTNWEADGLALNVGANVVQAFAEDAAGNVSLTNTVNFNYVSNAPPPAAGPAPASIAGTLATVNIAGDPGPFQVCFGQATFAQTSTNGYEDSHAGTYTYTVMSSNMAQLAFTTALPPNDAGPNGGVLLMFTNNSTAVFTNGGTSTGVVTFAGAQSLVPSGSAIITAQSVGASGNTNTIVFGGGTFTNTDGASYTNWGNYTLVTFSPVDMELIENFTDPADTTNTGYVQLDFSGTTNGLFFYSQFDEFGDLETGDSGPFNILSSTNQPAGNAPESPAGLIWNAVPTKGSKFQLSFGTSTYSTTDTNHPGVGIYSYVKTGPNTALFTQYETAPESNGPGNGNNNSNPVELTFKSGSTGTSGSAAVIQDGTNEVGTVTYSQPKFSPPASLAGMQISGGDGTITLNADGTFLLKSTKVTDSGNYSYSQYSPVSGMINWTVSSAGEDQGKTVFVQLSFTSATGGTLVGTTFDSGGLLDNVITSSFKLTSP